MKLLELECPHCQHNMNFFGKELNKSGKVKSCPQCGAQFRLNLDTKKMIKTTLPIVLILAVLVAALTFPNVSNTLILIAGGIAAAIGYLKATTLIPVDENPGT